MRVERCSEARHPSVRARASSVVCSRNAHAPVLPDYMIYTRGSEDDWNRYASLTGDDGWNWGNVLNYAKKVSVRSQSVARVDSSIHSWRTSPTPPTLPTRLLNSFRTCTAPAAPLVSAFRKCRFPSTSLPSTRNRSSRRSSSTIRISIPVT